MAEDGHWERKAKLRCETKAIKLAAAAVCVTNLAFVRGDEQGPEPVAAQHYLARNVHDLRKAWSSYEVSHDFLLGLVAEEQVEDVLGAFQTRLDYYIWALSKAERVLDGGSTALMDEGPAANEAEDPPYEAPADAEDKDPDAIMKAEVPMDEDPAAPVFF